MNALSTTDPTVTCTRCAKVVSGSDRMTGPDGPVCVSCHLEAETSERAKPKVTLGVIALVAALVPFVLSFRTTSSSSLTIDGVTQDVSSRAIDYVACAGGGLAIGMAVVALVGALRVERKLSAPVGLALAAFVVGVYQLIRGVGLLG